eukprot:TRINITY_DN10545_c0_g1_i3.p1 TRINITY_DN10545_c0_g1~~TRINITY_DN10545_c0_g1_i3.p1  ORF type:complete len:214 (+),score=52.07 TRINITY_DN10545_c0_g1_i3:75-716(+)
MEGKELVIAYWNIRGVAELSRRLLEYVGLSYVNKFYELSNAVEWFQDKQTLNHPFPNLPYIKDGDKVICESEAVHLYIILKSGKKELLGRNDEDMVTLASVKGVIGDIQKDMTVLFHGKLDQEAKTKLFAEKLIPRLQKLDKFVEGKKHVIGDYVTFIDFYFYNILDQFLQHFERDILNDYPNIRTINRNFEEIPAIKAYHETEAYKNRILMP